MPGDRFALAVGIGGEIDLARVLCILLQRLDQIALAPDVDILRREVMLDVDAELTLGQVAQMSHRRTHHVFLAEVLLDRLRLRGRLDDDQGLRRFLLRRFRGALLRCLFLRRRSRALLRLRLGGRCFRRCFRRSRSHRPSLRLRLLFLRRLSLRCRQDRPSSTYSYTQTLFPLALRMYVRMGVSSTSPLTRSPRRRKATFAALPCRRQISSSRESASSRERSA